MELTKGNLQYLRTLVSKELAEIEFLISSSGDLRKDLFFISDKENPDTTPAYARAKTASNFNKQLRKQRLVKIEVLRNIKQQIKELDRQESSFIARFFAWVRCE